MEVESETVASDKPLRRYSMNVEDSETEVLGLTSCQDDGVRGWSTNVLDRDIEQVCWNAGNGARQILCLYKRDSVVES